MVAFNQQGCYEDQVKMLKNLDPLVNKNNIGDALARRVVDMFQKLKYPDSHLPNF